MQRRPEPPADRPRAEPEIIPPERARARSRDDAAWTNGVQRIYVARLGPFGSVLLSVLLALAVVLLAAVALVVLLGAFLIAIPLAGLLLAVAIIAAMWRGRSRRPG